jgi:hypothetical protein
MDATEVENARMFANQAREHLRAEGFDDPTIDRLAEHYLAGHGSGSLEDFIDWAMAHPSAAHPDDPDRTGKQSFPASDPPSTWAGAEPGNG